MKKAIKSLILLIAGLSFNEHSAFAQTTIQIGTGTGITGTTTPSPVNIYYRNTHHQILYLTSEINAQGVSGQQILDQIQFNVTGLPIYAMPNYAIKIAHFTGTNLTANYAGPFTTVYTNSNYLPGATGWTSFNFSTPFQWNGVDNILIDICWDLVNPTWNASGTVQYTSSTSKHRYFWNDVTVACPTATSADNSTYRPNIKMRFLPVSANNLQGVAVLRPINLNQYCSGPLEVKALIKNAGSAPQSNFLVGAYYTNGTGMISANLSVLYTNTLAPNASDSVSFGMVSLPADNYSLVAYTLLSTDTLKNNDTTPSVTFVVKPEVPLPQTISDTVCAGGNANVFLTNPKPNTVYKWFSAPVGGNVVFTGNSVSFSPLIKDTIMFVSATSNGCESPRVAISAAIGPPPVVNLGNDTNFCESIPLILNAGNPGGKYLWSTGDSTQTITLTNISGKYWVKVDKYCLASDTIVVSIDPLPYAAGISYIRSGSSYLFSASATAFVTGYLWIFGDGATSTLPNPTHTYGPGINGDLMVKLVVYNDCGVDTVIRKVPTAIAGPDGSNREEIEVYPNPASRELFIHAPEVAIREVYLMNVAGSLVSKLQVPKSDLLKLDLQHLPSGSYLLRVNSDNASFNKMVQIVR